ncbi:MAG: hypothetical protein L6Q46_05955 [Flavobacterium sp.]|uniref:hypothetical protein n=1 Tax=Flavobacterium sp. TaxID=239 RepID=UPI0025BED53E|nr:hypothetical protein [Flavobacterium sp.]MCK6607834.1 hypothetical protein [Flavobacterium sp.]
MKKQFLLSLTLLIFTTNIFAQDRPQSCENTVTSYVNARGEIIAESKVAKEYYMTSNAPDAGSNYDERRANLRNRIKQLLLNYEQKRKNEYSLTTCTYYKTKSATSKSGRVRKDATIVIPEEYEFIPSSIEHTTNGDMKKGPSIVGRTIKWTTGTESGRASTFVRIKAKYTENFIKKSINQEIADIKLELNNLGIPAE